jgi:endonuclease/exonuclease/phosphatase family metal-dependent hydrolase
MDTIKVMTYNIHSGVGTDGKADWKRIADIIKEKDPDFLGLQEVCRFRPTNPTDLPKVLKEYLDLDLYFGESMTVQDLWHYGNAAGTKLKAELLDVVHFDIPEGEEPRVFLILKSCIAGREFYFCTCQINI